jgi:hypothetical protein
LGADEGGEFRVSGKHGVVNGGDTLVVQALLIGVRKVFGKLLERFGEGRVFG